MWNANSLFGTRVAEFISYDDNPNACLSKYKICVRQSYGMIYDWSDPICMLLDFEIWTLNKFLSTT